MTKKLPLFFLLFLPAGLQAQQLAVTLSAPVTVTSGSTYGTTRPRIALAHDSVPVVCWGKSGTTVFVSQWNGSGFTSPVQISPVGVSIYSGLPEGPDIAAKGDTVYVTYFSASDSKVYLVRSFDGGTSWSDTLRVDQQDSLDSYSPVVEIGPGGNPYIAYEAATPSMGSPNQFFTRSTDAGTSFSPEVVASSPALGQPCECCTPALAVKDTSVMVLFRNNMSNIRECYISYSGNSGNSFQLPSQIDFSGWNITNCPSSAPDMITVGDSVQAVWAARSGTTNKIFTGTWNFATQQFGWNRFADPNPPATTQAHPSVAGSNDTLAVVWDDLRNGNVDCWMSISISGVPGLNTLVQVNDSMNDGGTQNNVHLAYHNGLFHFVYTDLVTNSIIYRTGSISGFVGTNELQPEESIVQVFPNPADKELLLRVNGANEKSRFRIFDAQGRMIREELIEANGNHRIGISDLAAGVYSYRLTGDHAQAAGKFLVIH
ncbi:MAG: hypothetical protein FD123_3788 [Bacteroidetes bacterium]|nr:MAG: hypothetical protein FD123_3788 [Bacteroidota bacterium]